MSQLCTNCNQDPRDNLNPNLVDIRVIVGENTERRADVVIYLCNKCLPIYINGLIHKAFVSHRHDGNYLEDRECPIFYGGECPMPYESGIEEGYYTRSSSLSSVG